jgi:hypothetical protein
MEQKINLELTSNEINAILRSLGKEPFDEVGILIAKIRSKGGARLAAQASVEAFSTPDSRKIGSELEELEE